MALLISDKTWFSCGLTQLIYAGTYFWFSHIRSSLAGHHACKFAVKARWCASFSSLFVCENILSFRNADLLLLIPINWIYCSGVYQDPSQALTTTFLCVIAWAAQLSICKHLGHQFKQAACYDLVILQYPMSTVSVTWAVRYAIPGCMAWDGIMVPCLDHSDVVLHKVKVAYSDHVRVSFCKFGCMAVSLLRISIKVTVLQTLLPALHQ